jgi:hypothetical protein
MVARAEESRFTLAYGAAIAALSFGCGGTTLSNNDDPEGGGGLGSQTCTLSHDGDVVVRTAAELKTLRDHHFVSGDLIVDCPDCTTLAPLACLEEVGKMLSIVGCHQLESLEGLSALRRVGLAGSGGGLGIGFYYVPWETAGNARLRTLDGLGPLELVEGRIDVRKNPELRDLSAFAGLQRAGSLYLEDNDALTSLEDLGALQSLRGTLALEDNDALVDLTGLGTFSQTTVLRISGNDALVTLSGLHGFWGESSNLQIDISNNPALSDVTVLEHVQGTIRELGLRGNPSLRDVSLNPALAILSGWLIVSDNASLESFALPGLTHVASALQNDKNPLLATLDLGAPTSLGSLNLSENGSLRDTAAFAEVRLVTENVVIAGNPLLERVTLPELQEVGERLRINSNPVLAGFDLGALRRAESISVIYNALLPSCRVSELLSSVATTVTPSQCDNAPDECASDCPPRP